jgi:hypothetical protein
MADDISNRPSPDSPATAPFPAGPGSALEVARERTIRVLTDRFADDTLSIEEFEARLDRMYKATSPAELELLLREIERRVPQSGVGVQSYGSYPPAPMRRLLSLMSNTERSGRWAMPRQLHVRALMSSILLDLREVPLPPGLYELDLLAVMTSVEILVPPGVIVEDLALGVMANVENRALDEGYSGDAPRIRITGTVVMANVEVRVADPGAPPRVAWREAHRAWKQRLKGRR